VRGEHSAGPALPVDPFIARCARRNTPRQRSTSTGDEFRKWRIRPAGPARQCRGKSRHGRSAVPIEPPQVEHARACLSAVSASTQLESGRRSRSAAFLSFFTSGVSMRTTSRPLSWGFTVCFMLPHKGHARSQPRNALLKFHMPRRRVRSYKLSLTDEESRLLKELRGAGDRGRNLEQAQPGLERLMRAGYVKRSLIEGTTARYLITDFGRRNLDAAMER
jgi:hypothetical protein